MARRKKKRPLTERLAEVPLLALGYVLVSSGRAAGWAFERYRQAPLTNTALLALVLVSAVSAQNALFGQSHRHPAPLFANVSAAHATPKPVIPHTRPKSGPAKVSAQPKPADPAPAAKPTPAEIAASAAEPAGPTGNPDVFEIQRKLEKLALFTGTVDGYYGPETAAAIRKFESLNGLEQTGKLSADMVARIKAAPLSLGAAREASIAAPTPAAPTESPTITVPEAAPNVTASTLPAPTPLSATIGKTAGPAAPKPGVPLAVNEAAAPAASPVKELTGDATPAEIAPVSATDPVVIAKVQRGLASLGFLQGPADGVAGEATAKAIRNFETYFNYKVTGRITPGLLDLLVQNGAAF